MAEAALAEAPRKLGAMRAMIARKMHESLRDAAQISYFAEFDATRLIAARRAWRARHGHIGYEDLVISVLAACLADHPGFNGTFGEAGLLLSRAVHAGVAVALPGALVVPTIFDADAKSIAEIAECRADLLERARTGKLSVREMTGGTITVSNMGLSRTRFFTPILNAPQIAILGLGQIAERPWVVGGEVVAAPVMGLSLTTDHRLVDGQPSGALLTDLCDRLEAIAGPPDDGDS